MVKRANEFKTFYCENMNQILLRLEAHERERIEYFKSAADKIIVYETSQEMNNRYDAKIFSKIADSISTEKQLKFFKSKINLLKVP